MKFDLFHQGPSVFLPYIDLTIWVNSEVRHMHHQTIKCLGVEGNGIS
jgi:hypothetical protein